MNLYNPFFAQLFMLIIFAPIFVFLLLISKMIYYWLRRKDNFDIRCIFLNEPDKRWRNIITEIDGNQDKLNNILTFSAACYDWDLALNIANDVTSPSDQLDTNWVMTKWILIYGGLSRNFKCFGQKKIL